MPAFFRAREEISRTHVPPRSLWWDNYQRLLQGYDSGFVVPWWWAGVGGVSHMSDSCLHFNKLNCCYTENISSHDTDYLKFEVFERFLSLPHSKQALATIHYLFRTKFKSTCCKGSHRTDYSFKLNITTYLAFDKIFKFLKAVNHIVINSIIN